MDVIVVGGGIVGLATACVLASEGHSVQILERERPGSRASWVAAGLLTPSSPWRYPPALIELCFRSEDMYPQLVSELIACTGIDPEHEVAGMIYPEGVANDAAQIADHTRLRNELGFGVEHLERADLDRLQPGLGDEVEGAAFQRRSARVRPPRLLAGLVRRAEQLDVSIVSACEVTSLLADAGRIAGVRVAGGQCLPADAVVLAAGAWSGHLARSLGLIVDVRPVRGQILLLRGEPGVLGPTINDGFDYLVPRRDGRILVGSTMEDVGFEAVNTEEALSRMRRNARRLLPAVASMTEEMSWAGLRPGTPDRMPYLGPVEGCPGLVLATGHFRNGILLAPITARIVADVLAERAPSLDLHPFAMRPADPTAALLGS